MASSGGLVTIVFTDLVGSTALAQDLGDLAADEVRRAHFDALREAVVATGGTEVKNIGDALMLSYSSASDAIAGCVAMQQNVAAQNREGVGPPLEMRVGLSAGDASFEDGDWFGAPVMEAARLCSAADGDQILLTDIVRVLAELARHYAEAAALGEVDQAVAWGRKAGEAASGELAWEDAAAHYERAIDALELAEDIDPTVRCDLLIAAGDALLAINDQRGEELLGEAVVVARDLGDAARFSDATVILCADRLFREPGTVDEHRISLVEEALDRVGDTDIGRSALLMSAHAGELIWTPDAKRRGDLSTAALALARESGNRDVLARVLGQQFYSFDARDSLDEFLETTSEVIEMAEEMGNIELLCSALLGRAPGLITVGDRSAGERDLRAGEALTRRLRRPTLEYRAMVLRTASTLLSGKLVEAEQLMVANAEFTERHGFPDTSGPGHAFRLRYERGELGELEPLFVEMAEAQPTFPLWRTALLSIYVTTDRYEEAREHLRALAADNWAIVPRDGVWDVTVAAAARTAGVIGDLEIAAEASELALPFTDRLSFTGINYEQPIAMSVAMALTALERFDEADTLFASAIELSKRAEAPTFAAASQVHWAESYLTRNDPETANWLNNSPPKRSPPPKPSASVASRF